jgi:hypothetical protein
MDKAHEVRARMLAAATMSLEVDGTCYVVNLADHSHVLARATPEQLANFEISPAGYGIHWPDLDEDLSVDGLIGTRRATSPTEPRRGGTG